MRTWVAATPWGRRRSLAARHRIFCFGGGETLETCPAPSPSSYHDRYDRHALFFGASVPGHRWHDLPMVIATARLVLGPVLPTAEILPGLGYPVTLEPNKCYSEPSRVGLQQEFQGAEVGKAALLGMLGILVEESVAHGAHDALLTMRWRFFSALNWLPFTIGTPFLYPSTVGGPATTELIFPAVVNLHEVVEATRVLRPSYFKFMFPRPCPWLDPLSLRTEAELAETAQANLLYVRQWRTNYRKGLARPLIAV